MCQLVIAYRLKQPSIYINPKQQAQDKVEQPMTNHTLR